MMETFSKQTCIALIKPPWCYCYNAFLQTSSFDVTIECKAILQDSGFVCHSPFKQLGEFYDTDLQTIASLTTLTVNQSYIADQLVEMHSSRVREQYDIEFKQRTGSILPK